VGIKFYRAGVWVAESSSVNTTRRSRPREEEEEEDVSHQQVPVHGDREYPRFLQQQQFQLTAQVRVFFDSGSAAGPANDVEFAKIEKAKRLLKVAIAVNKAKRKRSGAVVVGDDAGSKEGLG